MTASPSAAALDQLRLRYRLAISTAESYRRNGFTVVLQDVIIGPMLEEFVAMVETRPFSLVVLAPEPDEVARREERRTKTGYRGLTAHDLDHVLRNDTPRLGHWLDSTDLTVAQTIDQLLPCLDTTARIA